MSETALALLDADDEDLDDDEAQAVACVEQFAQSFKALAEAVPGLEQAAAQAGANAGYRSGCQAGALAVVAKLREAPARAELLDGGRLLRVTVGDGLGVYDVRLPDQEPPAPLRVEILSMPAPPATETTITERDGFGNIKRTVTGPRP